MRIEVDYNEFSIKMIIDEGEPIEKSRKLSKIFCLFDNCIETGFKESKKEPEK